MHLRPGVREHFLDALARGWPEHVERYEALFATRAYLSAAVANAITEPVRRANASTEAPRRGRPMRPEPQQLALSV